MFHEIIIIIVVTININNFRILNYRKSRLIRRSGYKGTFYIFKAFRKYDSRKDGFPVILSNIGIDRNILRINIYNKHIKFT